MSIFRPWSWLIRTVLLFSLSIVTLHAHAILLSAIPAVNQVVDGPDVPIKLQFNSRIDAKRSIMVLNSSSGQTKLTIKKQVSPDMLSSEAKGLTPGAYILQWQVLANDGHITRGEVPFRVQ